MEQHCDDHYIGGVFSADKITKYWKNQTIPETIEGKFIDPLFPHSLQSLHGKNENDEFLDKVEGPKKAADIDAGTIEWKHAHEIFSKFLLFDNKIECDDIKQGNLGNCYFLNAIAALCEMPELIHQIFKTKEPQANGLYEIAMYIDGHWQIVIVDDYFPVIKGTNDLKFAKPNGNELWVILLEKAWAKINGGYSNIIAGWPVDPLAALTGFATQKVVHNQYSNESLWRTLLQAEQSDNIMCASTNTKAENETQGLVSNHAYTLIGAKEEPNSNLRLVRLRNPWGYKEWNGQFADKSNDWTDDLKSFFEYSDKDDGTFFMNFEDFKTHFDRTDVCHVTYDSNVKLFEIKLNEADNLPLIYNFYIDKDAKIAISAIRKHWRYTRNLKNVLYPTSMVIARLDETTKQLEYIDGEYSAIENVEIVRDFKRGLYAVWLYCPVNRCDEPKPKKIILRFISSANFKAKHEGSDSNSFEFISEIMKAAVKEKNREKVNGKESFNSIENGYKRSGLGFRYANNKSSTASYHRWINNAAEIQKVFVFPPFENQSEFTFYVPPHSDMIVLCMRTRQYDQFWFNLKSDIKSVKASDVPKEFLKPKIVNIETYINASIIHAEFGPKYYDYMSKSLQDSKAELQFKQLNLKEVQFDDLMSKYPREIALLAEINPVDEDADLTWGKIKYDNGTYIGQTNSKKARHGRGYYTWSDGSGYAGYWVDGIKDTYGKYFDKDKKMTFEGEISKGLRNGTGKLFYGNGDSYEGAFVNDKRIGQGVYTWAGGMKWMGPFVNNQMHGVGMYYSEDPNEEPWECEYANGQYV